MIYNFRIDVLRNYVKIGELYCSNCIIKFDKNAEVSKGLQLTVSADKEKMTKEYRAIGSDPSSFTFNKFTDRIRPVLIRDDVEEYLGIYMVMASPEELTDIGSTYDLEAYDETMILKQACFTSRVNFTAGTKYLSVVNSLLTECGFTRVIEDPSDAVLSTDFEVAPGNTYLEVINSFLDGINYQHIHANNLGQIIVRSFDQTNEADHIYSDKKNMRIILPIQRNTDIYSLPNVITGLCSIPELDDPISYTRTNTNPDSLISIPSRGYKVTKVYQLNNVADLATLKDYVDRKFLESTQVTETVKIQTALEGGHEYGDMVQISTDLLSGLFYENSWEMRFGVSGTMTHELERRVSV